MVLIYVAQRLVTCNTKIKFGIPWEALLRVVFSYGQVEEILATMNRVAPAKRAAFRARLRHFQSLGFPQGINTGKGQRASYGFRHLMQMVVALELSQAGITPARIVKIVSYNWSPLRQSLFISMSSKSALEQWHFPPDPQQAWIIRPEALRELSVDGDQEVDYYESVEIVPLKDLAAQIVSTDRPPIVGQNWRALVLQVREITRMMLFCLVECLPNFVLSDALQDTGDEIDEQNAAIEGEIEIWRAATHDRHSEA